MSVAIVIRVNSHYLLAKFENVLQLLQSWFWVICYYFNFLLIDEVFLVCKVLPVDVAIFEYLHFALIVHWETWIRIRDRLYLLDNVLVLFKLNCERTTSKCKLVYQFNRLVTEFPELNVLFQDFMQVVQRCSNPLGLICIFNVETNQKRSFELLYDQEIITVNHLESFLYVLLWKLIIAKANMSKHVSYCIPDKWEFYTLWKPPNFVRRLVNQKI